MIGIWSANAQQFLLVLGIATTIFFAIPIFAVPLVWARLMLWRVPEDTNLTIYFGRCLGAFVLMMEFLILRAGVYGTGITMVFEIMMIVWIFMTIVHVWGWLTNIQPVTETIEIGLWLLLIALTLVFWPNQA
ncbi:MAG: hypothetical protein ABL901_06030 [Hyphomicrobiaceae bacterium]